MDQLIDSQKPLLAVMNVSTSASADLTLDHAHPGAGSAAFACSLSALETSVPTKLNEFRDPHHRASMALSGLVVFAPSPRVRKAVLSEIIAD